MLTVHFLQKHLRASKTFGTLQISISSSVAKLPLQSQLGVIQPQQRESERGRQTERETEANLWRASVFKQIGDQGGARWNPCGLKELMLLFVSVSVTFEQ